MINEELFTKVLANRATLSNKGKRINTKVAVERLRIKLDNLEAEGYDQEVLMNLMLDRGWLGIQKKWLTMLKPRNLKAPRNLSGAVQGLVKHTAISKSNYQAKHAHANQVRQQGRDALEEMKRVLK